MRPLFLFLIYSWTFMLYLNNKKAFSSQKKILFLLYIAVVYIYVLFSNKIACCQNDVFQFLENMHQRQLWTHVLRTVCTFVYLQSFLIYQSMSYTCTRLVLIMFKAWMLCRNESYTPTQISHLYIWLNIFIRNIGF